MVLYLHFITLRIICFGFFFSFQTWPSFWLCWNDQTSQVKNRTLKWNFKIKKKTHKSISELLRRVFWDFLSCQGTTLQKLDFSKSFQWDHPMRLANERIFNSSAKCSERIWHEKQKWTKRFWHAFETIIFRTVYDSGAKMISV